MKYAFVSACQLLGSERITHDVDIVALQDETSATRACTVWLPLPMKAYFVPAKWVTMAAHAAWMASREQSDIFHWGNDGP